MCENLRGSYRCVCNLGYEPGAAGKQCVGERARRAAGGGRVRGPPPSADALTAPSRPHPCP